MQHSGSGRGGSNNNIRFSPEYQIENTCLIVGLTKMSVSQMLLPWNRVLCSESRTSNTETAFLIRETVYLITEHFDEKHTLRLFPLLLYGRTLASPAKHSIDSSKSNQSLLTLKFSQCCPKTTFFLPVNFKKKWYCFPAPHCILP